MVSFILLIRLGLDALFSPSPVYQDSAKNFVLTFASAFGAPFLVWRAWIAHRQANAASEQARVAAENHITGIFSKSVELLGFVREGKIIGQGGTSLAGPLPNVEARLGALYSLERLLIESQKDQRAILETLCAYVRENSPLEIPEDKDEAQEFFRGNRPPSPTRRADVQAALTIIGRRPENLRVRAKHNGWRLDLRNTNLIGYDLAELNYDYARFANSFLNGANMSDASFVDCIFDRTFMRNAKMMRASFCSAIFDDCDVRDAEIETTDFSLANIIDTDLRAAKVVNFNIKGANLEKAFGTYLKYSIDSVKRDGPNSINSMEILSIYQLFQKATHDDATNVSEAVRDAILMMAQSRSERGPDGAQRNPGAA